MSGPTLGEQVYSRDSSDLERKHIQNLRNLADRVEDDESYFAQEDRVESRPDGLDDTERRAIAALLRAKADKLEAHMDAIDSIMSDEFSSLVHDVEWCSSFDYGPGKVAETWREYDG